MKKLLLNAGAQKLFVANEHRASAYIGGLGSGKTFAGIARGIKHAQAPIAPDTRYGPRGCAAAINYPVLRDVVLPQFLEMMEGTDLWKTGRESTSWVKSEMKARLVANCRCKDKHACSHVTEILFRSLDRPNWMRGMELAWFFIDEGRHVTREAWDILYGRLRQKGYAHAGWVCSTPNGYDWMWDVFHPESPKQLDDAEWYGAPTYENVHLPSEYVRSLEMSYSGRFFEQEVLGHFVGMTEGAVFFEWDSREMVREVDYDPSLPLYSEWDFGMGDLNVVLFVQTRKVGKFASDGERVEVLEKRYIGAMEASERTSGQWATAFKDYCDEHFNGRRPVQNFGDPAGKQRNQVTGTSVIDDLRVHGIVITPAPKRPADYAIRIMNSMMADKRILVDRKRCERLAQAFSSARWPRDASGNRTGNSPVHDWTSHYSDAARYGTTCLVGFYPTRYEREEEAGFAPNQYGYVFQALLEEPESWLGPQPERAIEWEPGIIRPRS